MDKSQHFSKEEQLIFIGKALLALGSDEGEVATRIERYQKQELSELSYTAEQIGGMLREAGINIAPVTDRPVIVKANGHANGISTGKGFYVKTPLDATMDPRLIHSEYRLLGLLINLAGTKGYLWHSKETLAGMMIGEDGRKGVSISTIERGIKKLESTDYLAIVKPENLKANGLKHFTRGNTYVLRLNLRDDDTRQ